MQELSREPKEDVKRILRREVGFSCPVLETNGRRCGCPYLTWHHFDPKWKVMKHHNPEGMIALCSRHHALADGGRYTNGELRFFKTNPRNRDIEFNRNDTLGWMRHDLLAIVGGNFYYQSPILLRYDHKPIIWFGRDEQGYLLINMDLSPLTSQTRLSMKNNDWGTDMGELSDFKCPPNGKGIEAHYDNGDKIKLEFVEILSEIHFSRRYDYIKKKAQSSIEKALRNTPKHDINTRGALVTIDPFSFISKGLVPFPITSVEMHVIIKEANLECGRDVTTGEVGSISCNFVRECPVALDIGPNQISLGTF